MLSRRREKEIRMRVAMEQQAYRQVASKKGAITILMIFAGIGFITAFMIGQKVLCS